MKKILSLAIIFCCVLAMPVVAAMKSNPVNDNASQNNKSDSFRSMHATNIKIAKKIPASLIIGETKGKPSSPPGQDEEDDFSERTATGFLGAPLVDGAKKYAVVIGICDYPEGEVNYDICLSDGDSYNMYKALTRLYGYEPENIYWFRDSGGTIDIIIDGVEVKINYEVPTHENIRKAVIGTIDDTTSTFAGGIKDEVMSGDEVAFFFSGHGASGTVVDGVAEGVDDGEPIDEAIIVHDSDGLMDGDGYATLDFIWDGELRSWFYDFETERIIFMFDTCLAGGMNDVASDGRVVVMSSKETQSSYVYSTGELGEGMFSRHFVNKGMLQGLADGYNQIPREDDLVVVEEAFDYAKEKIPPYLKFRQNPVITDLFTKDLLLGY